MATIAYEKAAEQTLATTEVNALANGSGILCAAYDNGAAGNHYLYAQFEINVDFVSAPTLGPLIELYLVPAQNGTNYADTTGGATPFVNLDHFVGTFYTQATTAAQRIALTGLSMDRLISIPATLFKAYVINRSGQAFPATGSTIKMVPVRLAVG